MIAPSTMNGTKLIKFYHNGSSVAFAITPSAGDSGFMQSYSIGSCWIDEKGLLEVFKMLLQTATVLFECEGYCVVLEPSFREWFEGGMLSVYGAKRQKPWAWDVESAGDTV